MGLLSFLFKARTKQQRKGPYIPPAKLKGKLLGKITHYFPKAKAAVLKLSYKPLKLGDRIYIKGHTTNFIQVVSSLQINNKPIKRAQRGKTVGLQVKEKVRKKDKVYLVGEDV